MALPPVPPKGPTPSTKTAYHYAQGPVEMYAIDANHAVGNFPDEWAFVPWSPEESDAAHRIQEERHKAAMEEHKRAATEAEAAGLPKPAAPRPPLRPVPPNETQKADIATDTKVRSEAADFVRRKDEERFAAEQELNKENEARAILAAPPPQAVAAVPDGPAAPPGTLTKAERERNERLKAAREIRNKNLAKERQDREQKDREQRDRQQREREGQQRNTQYPDPNRDRIKPPNE